MTPPLISICIPAYNAAPYIVETLKSWQDQTYSNIQVIVQDDYSTDSTYETALEIAKEDARIKVFRNTENLGIGANWNEAYDKATGDFVVIANADDIYHSDMILNALNILIRYQELDSVSFKYLVFNESLNTTHELEIQRRLRVGIQEELFKTCFFYNPFHIVFSVFKKSSLDKILLSNHQLFLNTQICDAELFFRIGINNFNHYYSDFIAGKYRKHETNNSYKPNGESYSWLHDVLPLYKNYLLKNYPKEIKRLILNKIIYQFKYGIKNLKKLDINQTSTLVKNYFYF